MKILRHENRIDTTLGDLIAAISDVAFEYSADTKEAYALVRLVLLKILQGASRLSEVDDWRFARMKYRH